MKKKRNLILAFSVVLGMALTGCGQKEEPKKEQVEEKQYPVIGKESKDGYAILFQNNLDQGIMKVSIKPTEEETYPDGMGLEEDREWEVEETVKICYTPEKTEKKQEETDKKVNELYDIQITLADESTVELNEIGFDDFKEGKAVKLCSEDDVVFLQYTSASTDEKVSTKERQIAIKEQKEAEEKAKKEAEEKAAQEAEQQTPVYEEPVYQEPVYQEPVVQQPVVQEPTQNTDSCLGDVLVQ